MKYQDLVAKLKMGKMADCYFFYGEEDYLKHEAIILLKRRLIKPEAEDFDFAFLHAEDNPAREAISLAETFPFMSKKRLVVIKDTDRFIEADLREIIEYLKKPSPFTCLVLTTEKIKKEALNRGLYKTISSLCETVVFWRLFDSDTIRWIEEKISREGKTISREAAHYLLVEVGNNLADLSGEIEKLLIYAGDRSEVTLGDVEHLIGHFKGNSIFELLKAITRKNSKESLEILSRLIETGESPAGILIRIAKRIRQIICAKELLEQKIAPAEIIEEVGLHPFFDRDFTSQVQDLDVKELLTNFSRMLHADWEIKVGRKPAQFVLELLILDLCGEKKASTYYY